MKFRMTSCGSPVAVTTFPDTVQAAAASAFVCFRGPAEATDANESDASKATTAADANVRDLNIWNILQGEIGEAHGPHRAEKPPARLRKVVVGRKRSDLDRAWTP